MGVQGDEPATASEKPALEGLTLAGPYTRYAPSAKPKIALSRSTRIEILARTFNTVPGRRLEKALPAVQVVERP
jgi:hypothetical protein